MKLCSLINKGNSSKTQNMGLFSFLTGDNKKKKKRKCDITGTILEYGEGRLVTTSQVVSSHKFWDSIMTEPEAMAYTINHFKNKDSNATQMRSIIFEKYAEKTDPWLVAEDCIQTFGIEANGVSREYAEKWWESDYTFQPPGNGTAKEVLGEETYTEVKKYAVMEAGASRVA